MRTVRWTLSTAVILLLAACSSQSDDVVATSPAPPTEATASPDAAPTQGPTSEPGSAAAGDDASSELLAFSGRRLSGGTFDGAAVTGDVVVWFWTPW
ncbi:MAG: hypothetical protein WEB03_02690 [Nitriliruptor sp.]|uniref:hypothetical protein n=1 Tax=Nitriliruptor sp. TaxID=2448056 RepID=UPI0034A062CE